MYISVLTGVLPDMNDTAHKEYRENEQTNGF